MAVFESTVIEFDLEHRRLRKLTLDELTIDLHVKNKIYWVHCNLLASDDLKKITDKLQLPENVTELCKQDDTIPKLIDVDDAITVQIQCSQSEALNYKNEVDYSNLILHLTSHYCFTAASQPIPVLAEFMEISQKAIRFAKTPCFILFLILDSAVNDYARVLFNFELLSEEIDKRIHTDDDNIYNEVMDIKQQIMLMKRYVISVREIVMRISGRKITVISDQCRASLSNLSGHAHMLVHEIDSIREMLNSLLDQIDNALMQKMNETMRVLTAFAAIFLPLSLITGIYGMNFHWMPELNWKYGYFIVLFVIFLCGSFLFYLFKKRKWF